MKGRRRRNEKRKNFINEKCKWFPSDFSSHPTRLPMLLLVVEKWWSGNDLWQDGGEKRKKCFQWLAGVCCLGESWNFCCQCGGGEAAKNRRKVKTRRCQTQNSLILMDWWRRNTKANCLPKVFLLLFRSVKSSPLLPLLASSCSEWKSLTSAPRRRKKCRREFSWGGRNPFVLLLVASLTHTRRGERICQEILFDLLLLFVCIVISISSGYRLKGEKQKRENLLPQINHSPLRGGEKRDRFPINFFPSASNSICNMLQFLPVKSAFFPPERTWGFQAIRRVRVERKLRWRSVVLNFLPMTRTMRRKKLQKQFDLWLRDKFAELRGGEVPSSNTANCRLSKLMSQLMQSNLPPINSILSLPMSTIFPLLSDNSYYFYLQRGPIFIQQSVPFLSLERIPNKSRGCPPPIYPASSDKVEILFPQDSELLFTSILLYRRSQETTEKNTTSRDSGK